MAPELVVSRSSECSTLFFTGLRADRDTAINAMLLESAVLVILVELVSILMSHTGL
jgi:hypothetical protein